MDKKNCEKKKINIRSERGSATLFVLSVMMSILLIIVMIYVSQKNVMNMQLNNIRKIENEYNSKSINEIYNKTINQMDFSGDVNYETAFPLKDYGKPYFVGNLINATGNNYFTVEGTTLKSNNAGVIDSHANTYIPIDLRIKAVDYILNISINTTISSENNADFGYAAITETTTTPLRSSTGKIMYISGATATNTYNTQISGGKIYYLHFGYTKDSSNNSNNDCFIVNYLNFED